LNGVKNGRKTGMRLDIAAISAECRGVKPEKWQKTDNKFQYPTFVDLNLKILTIWLFAINAPCD
jgi:hypothetical protein